MIDGQSLQPSKKTVLLTGIAGFIGYWTAEALAKKGHRVIGVDNFNSYYDPALKKERAERLSGKCQIFDLDICDRENIIRLFDSFPIDQVCHLAAQAGVRYSLENPWAYDHTNNLGTLNLLENCKRKGIASFVYASSSSVYGGNKKLPFSVEDRVDSPISIYAATKRYNELLAHTYHHLYGIHCTGLRFFTVYGPWGRPDMALFKFTEAIIEGKPLQVFNFGRMKRNFTYISDIVDGVLASLERDYPYEIFNLGNPRTVDLIRFIESIEQQIGRDAIKKMAPLQAGDVPEAAADIQKSKKMLGFDPKVEVEEGIRNFVDWYRSYYEEKGVKRALHEERTVG